jgi:hypothetical protein
MPIYFGNCFVDNKETPGDPSDDVTLCKDGVFPFYDSGVRDGSGNLIPEEWYYGELDPALEDYPDCDPNDPIWDSDGDGNPDPGACVNEWEETVGPDLYQYRRRVKLEIPATWGGQPNHFLAVDTGGNLVGNEVVTETGVPEDYDLDGTREGDYDGDDANDWMMYVNSVEERDYRICAPAASLPTWTPTPTITPTLTPTITPTPTPTPVCRVSVYDMRSYSTSAYSGYMGATINNGHAETATITRIYFDWATGMRKWAYNEWHRICTDGGGTSPCGSYTEEIWDDGSGSYSVVPYTGKYQRPVDLTGPPYVGMYNNPEDAEITGNTTTHWWAYIRDNAPYVVFDGVYEVCFDFMIYGGGPGGTDQSCPDVCAVTYEGSFGTPTPTFTPTPPPTASPTPTFDWPDTPTRTPTTSGGPTNTPTRTPTIGTLPTSTPTPWPTPTPPPPTPTPTASRTPTPPT